MWNTNSAVHHTDKRILIFTLAINMALITIILILDIVKSHNFIKDTNIPITEISKRGLNIQFIKMFCEQKTFVLKMKK